MAFRFNFPALLSKFIISVLWFIMLRKSNARTTHPSEVRALTSIFQQWDVQIPRNLWNISGEPCSGTALGPDFDVDYNNPAIECNCSFDSNTTCHITKLKVGKLNRQGVIPEEIAALTYLTVLKIDQNAFTGTLPAFLGNLSAMTYLSLAHNQFSGTIPRELGNLKNLIMLAVSSNRFSGTLPPELGNLVKLELLYLDSCGAGGEIPSTFAKLTKMREMWASDNPFSGKIPSFIGNWTKLQKLRLQGNIFEGPIPASFSNLTSLNSLRISDLQNVSSSLDFITSLRNVTDLVIRNALVSGPIPPDINKLQQLVTLDLSFNNLNGSLPQTLMNMSSLVSLFLGNNSLSGSLLPDKSTNLLNIDLSYNQLSGSFPQWVTPMWSRANLQLNLVANNFIFDSKNISIFPGLNCLQRGFPCNGNTTPWCNIDQLLINSYPIRFQEAIIDQAATMTTNASGVLLPVLTTTNYTTWAVKAETILRANSVWEAIEPATGSTVDDRKNCIAKAIIYQSLPDDLLQQVAKNKSAKDVWNALHARHVRADRGRKFRLESLTNELESLRMKEHESVDEFSGKLSGFMDKFKELGSCLEDEAMVRKLFLTVPRKFVPMVACFEQMFDLKAMPFEEAVGRLKKYEKRINGLRVAQEDQTSGDQGERRYGRGRGYGNRGSGRGRGRGRGNFNRDKSNFRCYECGMFGHFAYECTVNQD